MAIIFSNFFFETLTLHIIVLGDFSTGFINKFSNYGMNL